MNLSSTLCMYLFRLLHIAKSHFFSCLRLSVKFCYLFLSLHIAEYHCLVVLGCLFFKYYQVLTDLSVQLPVIHIILIINIYLFFADIECMQAFVCCKISHHQLESQKGIIAKHVQFVYCLLLTMALQKSALLSHAG